MKTKETNLFKNLEKKEAVIFILFLLFSWFLMTKTFKIDAAGNLEVATKAWSDFSATIPVVRSFSYGDNFPPQYPLFAGPPIRYHFTFFSFVGILEKIGLRLDLALNILSALSFSALLVIIYTLGKTVFEKRSVGLLSVILFLLNGSFSFLEFFKNHPISINTVQEIINSDTFASFGPYDGKIVSAFWSLNIFTNQRHLALAYAAFLLLLLIVFIASKKPGKFTTRKSLLLGVAIGLFPFVHLAVFGMMGIVLITSFILYPKIRTKILTTGIVAAVLALPQLALMGPSQVKTEFLAPGYLIENLTLPSFLNYWFLNLGLTSILAPVGFLLVKKSQRKLFIPFLSLFVIGNLFQFSTEIAANHKFFNLYVIGVNFFTAALLVKLWRKDLVGKFLVPVALVGLTLSGVIDFFPIINDRYSKITDIPNNNVATFISKNTPKNATFLNSSFLYDPASLAGRKIYLGWPYFAWSAGYDTSIRHDIIRDILSRDDKKEVCDLLTREGIDYIEIKNPTDLENVTVNYSFFEDNFVRIYLEPDLNISIYDVDLSCKL